HRALRSFVEKAIDLMEQGINLLIIDPFPPGKHDPQGIHKVILEEYNDNPFELPAGKPLTLVSYQVEPLLTAYVEPVAVGDRLPDMALFLDGDEHIYAPLEETYQTTWNVLPGKIRKLVEQPAAFSKRRRTVYVFSSGYRCRSAVASAVSRFLSAIPNN